MIFYSLEFIFFFLVLLFLVKSFARYEYRREKELFICASYFFYGYWSYKALILIIVLTLGNYLIGQRVGAGCPKRKVFLWLSIIFNLGILGYFKYYNFFIDSFNALLPAGSLPLSGIDIIMPLGISFYIFQAMTYPIDIYEQRIKPVSFRDCALYIAFFPKLIVGPIAPASQFLPQLTRQIILTKANFAAGTSLFLVGLSKKKLLADSLTIFVDEVFSHPDIYDSWSLFCAALAYSMQIYLDFSGYSDMAIGIAIILGFTLPINFNYPYKACSVTDFWRRWHISLSSWLRDYLYIPLGGSRKGRLRTYINLFITFFLCGLWHGAGLTYIIWGIVHGTGLIIHKLWLSISKQNEKKKSHSTQTFFKTTIAIFVTYIFVTFGWILFRASTLTDAWLFWGRIITGAEGVRWVHISFYLITPFFLIWHLLPNQKKLKNKVIRFDTWQGLTVSLALVLLVLLFSPLGSSPFIYFQF